MTDSMTPLASLPSPSVVDVSQSLNYYLSNDSSHNSNNADHLNAIAQLKASIESCGFLYISGCDALLGYDNPLLMSQLFQLIDDFFSLPLIEKEKSISKDKARRGYSPSESDNFASLLLGSNNNTYANDTVEKFRIGPLKIPEGVITKNIHFFPNNFEHLSIELQQALVMYYRSMEVLSKYILSLIGEIYFNNPHYFDSLIDKHTSILTFNYFNNSNSTNPSSVRIAPHTDVSILTILRPNSNGLQIYHNNDWLNVDYIPNTFVINIGDYLQDLINVKSTVHRVITTHPSQNRVSIAFFVSPNYDSIINNITYDEWRKERIKKAMKK